MNEFMFKGPVQLQRAGQDDRVGAVQGVGGAGPLPLLGRGGGLPLPGLGQAPHRPGHGGCRLWTPRVRRQSLPRKPLQLKIMYNEVEIGIIGVVRSVK
jgi:hypothetical protein